MTTAHCSIIGCPDVHELASVVTSCEHEHAREGFLCRFHLWRLEDMICWTCRRGSDPHSCPLAARVA